MWNVNKIIWPNAKRYVAAIRNHFIQCTIFTTQWTLSLAVVSAQLSPLRMKTQNSDHLQQQRQPNIDKSLVSKHQFNGEKTTSEQIRNGSFYNFDFIQILLLHLNHVFTQFFCSLFFVCSRFYTQELQEFYGRKMAIIVWAWYRLLETFPVDFPPTEFLKK